MDATALRREASLLVFDKQITDETVKTSKNKGLYDEFLRRFTF